MKKFLIQSVLLLLIIAAGIFFFTAEQKGQQIKLPFLPKPTVSTVLWVNGHIIKVEVADTREKRAKGLAGRDQLASDAGMLFVFDKLDKYNFWMKGLQIPLDFVWIKENQVVDILENVPPPAPGVDDASLSILTSKVEIDKVLEVNVGTVQRLNIKVGDTIKLSVENPPVGTQD